MKIALINHNNFNLQVSSEPYLYMKTSTLAFLISKLRFFVEFDVMKKGGLENLIPGSTFTNISVKNMKGSKNYDNIWISKHAKLHHFTGQAGKEGMI